MTDVLIIGGGPAGLTAALYAARKELAVTVISTDIGGQMLLTGAIDNYPGMPHVSGFELSDRLESHVKSYPVTFVTAGVKALAQEEDGTFLLHLEDGKKLSGKTVIVTAGKRSRLLNIPGEEEYTGRRVSYCATCDAPFYRKKTVAVIGGGDSAVQAAIELSRLCEKVYLLVRSRIRASEVIVRTLKSIPNVEVRMGVSPMEVLGEKKVSGLLVKDGTSSREEALTLQGVFIEAGGIPNNSFLPSNVAVNEKGEVRTDKEGRTNIPGLFAAGDVTDSKNKQIIIAAGEGAAAALAAHEYLLMKAER